MMDAQEQAGLGPSDYEALFHLSIGRSNEAGQAKQIVNKLTPDEQSAFYAYVNANHRGNGADRKDDVIASGIPVIGSVSPEGAVMAGGLARAAVSGGVTGAARIAGSLGATYLKYKATKSILQGIGLPVFIAEPVAIGVAGFPLRGSGAAAETAAAEAAPAVEGPKWPDPKEMSPLEFTRMLKRTRGGATAPAAPVAPVASGPVAQGPPAAPASPPSAPPPLAASAPIPAAPIQAGPPAAVNTLPDQKSLNEAALAVRRAAYQQRLAAQSSAQMSEMTAEGAAKASAAPPYVKPAPLTKDETIAFTQLLKRMPGSEAMKTILAQRELASRFGTLSNADVASEIANRTGNKSPTR